MIGLAGSLLTFLIQSVYADNLNWQHAGDPVMMTILGGIHHFLGPTWGAIIFIMLERPVELADGALVAVLRRDPDCLHSSVAGRHLRNLDCD